MECGCCWAAPASLVRDHPTEQLLGLLMSVPTGWGPRRRAGVSLNWMGPWAAPPPCSAPRVAEATLSESQESSLPEWSLV